jgi:hypothetical protein
MQIGSEAQTPTSNLSWVFSRAAGAYNTSGAAIILQGNGNGAFQVVSTGPSTGAGAVPASGNFYYLINVTSAISQVRTAWTLISDRRLKTNLEPIVGALETVRRLQPWKYTRIDDPSKRQHYGFIAQEVQRILPHLVMNTLGNAPDGSPYLGITESELTSFLVGAIKELAAENETLSQRLDRIELMLMDRKGGR